MWEVVKRVKGNESIAAGPLPYSVAFAKYEKMAEKFNRQDADGVYVRPNVRVGIRKVA